MTADILQSTNLTCGNPYYQWLQTSSYLATWYIHGRRYPVVSWI